MSDYAAILLGCFILQHLFDLGCISVADVANMMPFFGFVEVCGMADMKASRLQKRQTSHMYLAPY